MGVSFFQGWALLFHRTKGQTHPDRKKDKASPIDGGRKKC